MKKMTKQDLMKVFYILKASYPRFFVYSNSEIDQMIIAWQLVLEDYTYEQVIAGLKYYLTMDTKGFPPSQGQIVEAISKVSAPINGVLTADECWNRIVKAVSNSYYNSSEEYGNLPDICKKFIGSADNLKYYGDMDSVTFNTVIRSNFLKSHQNYFMNKIEDQKTLSLKERTIGLIEEKGKE